MNYKQLIHNRLEKMKTKASRLVSSGQDDADYALELDPHTYQKLKMAADERQTTVQAVLSHMVEQYLSHGVKEMTRQIPEESKEQNPLLLLDGICGRVR
ncbi:hypothetical protein [Paenibacillus hamazuiensis]|uniref:hypothetical protein n=1 Tax=Paenibacillus hamazuiensis TaxID=2936508 RepID=UPI00200F11C5|nr:hypothetical protein [Paenibacillus hamazuiensis]